MADNFSMTPRTHSEGRNGCETSGGLEVLYCDDFSDLPVGVIGGDYTPSGEYHVVPALADSGRWRETVVHHSFRRVSRGNWQIVLETDESHVLEQTIVPPLHEPMLAAGWPYDWPATVIEAGIRPLTHTGRRMIVFRYLHARRFYAAVFNERELQVIRRHFDSETILAETACELNCEIYTPVRIDCGGDRITVSVAGYEVLTCNDTEPGGWTRGGAAFSATDLTRFSNLKVSAAGRLAKEYSEEQSTQQKKISLSRERYPNAVLWKKIPTSGWGTDRNLRAGDIDGDGRNEILLAQSTDRLGRGDACSITCIAAFNLDGDLLWTLGEPGPGKTHTTADLCFQVHDLDRDGRAEVHFARDFEYFRADGRTGKPESMMKLPRRTPAEGESGMLYRVLGDSLYFCDLTGNGYPDSMIVKDRYRNAWAYDRDLNQLWSFSGTLGHYPFGEDIDGDGRDEILLGYHLLDAQGREQCSVPFIDHADNVVFADLHDGDDMAVMPVKRIVMAASDAGFYIMDTAGNVRVHHALGHAQSMCIANVLPGRSGLEIMCNTFWGAAGITAVMDETGGILKEFEPMPYACLLQPVNWSPLSAGDRPADLVLLSTHPRQGGLIDGNGIRRVVFPDDGHPVLCSDVRDIDGDGIDEVLTWDREEIWIYKADSVAGRTPENYPRRNPWYNDSNYRAQVSLPVNGVGAAQ
mgnify:CR=1 FL=1